MARDFPRENLSPGVTIDGSGNVNFPFYFGDEILKCPVCNRKIQVEAITGARLKELGSDQAASVIGANKERVKG